ncbi:MAG: T9SS type A sorting domain-containing protein [Bacteroidales bacterium]
MKNFFILIATILLFVGVANSQEKALLLSESFDGPNMPAGWSIKGVGLNNWKIKSTMEAGGEPNEISCNWNPQFTGISRLVSPAIDLSGISSFNFTFKMNINFYSGSITIGVATSSDNGANWNNGWSKAYSTNTTTTVFEEISTPDCGESNVLVCLYISGSSYNFNDIYFDDIEAFTLENLDAKVQSINLDNIIDLGENEVGFSVANYGLETINSLDADLYINDELVTNEEFTDLSIESLNSKDLTFTYKPEFNKEGIYEVKVVINLANGQQDDEELNNSLIKSVSPAILSTDRTVMVELFTSSTCGPCAGFNPTLDNLLANNPGKYTINKYQMNWPGAGDPYYNDDGATRRFYYGVSGVPACYIDGSQTYSVNQYLFNNALAEPAYLDIIGNYTIDGNTVHLDFDVVSFASVVDVCLLVSINEKKTTGNVGGNGETEFHHVMMIMLPSGNGSTISLEAGVPKHFTFSQNMADTHVEEMDDLEVSVFVQKPATRYVFNSKFLESVDQLLLPVQNLTCTSSDNIKATLSWEKPEGANPVSYNVYYDNDLISNTTELTMEVDVDNELNTYSVEAVYSNDLVSVKSSVLYYAGGEIEELLPVQNLVVSNEEFMISWDAPAAGNPLSYNIYVNNEVVGNTTDLFYVFDEITKSADVCVTALYQNGESPKECITVDWLNIGNINTNITLYPNPAKNVVSIDGVSVQKVLIYNNLGQLVQEFSNTNQINISNLNQGVYFLNIIDINNNNYNQKLMVE